MSEEIPLHYDNEKNIRLEKLKAWYDNGYDPFPAQARKNQTVFSQELIRKFKEKPELSIEVTVAGRMILKRDFGKVAFVSIRDEEGDLQLYFKKDILGENNYELFKLLDLSDIISATGKMFLTQKGEPTLEIHEFQILTKSLRPLPEKFHGLENIETRYRKRYLDLITHKHVKENFVIRSKLVHIIREYLYEKGFLEVETPMMHPIPGGAAAKPFITHHNALNSDLFLRIAPELYLKRLVIGGMHKIFEINRNFRNEGIDSSHNPEFTMLELYEAYANWRDMANLFIELITKISISLKGTTKISYQNTAVDIAKWKEISYSEALKEKGIDPEKIKSSDEALEIAKKHHLKISKNANKWEILAELFDHLVADHIIEPTIIFDYPSEISPLSKRKSNNPELAERFEAYAFQMELSNGFSELNNPFTQKKAFEDQMKKKKSGNHEAMEFDADYIEALEQGLPPTGGIGIGVDRLTMIFIDAPCIKDVILFPTMKSKI